MSRHTFYLTKESLNQISVIKDQLGFSLSDVVRTALTVHWYLYQQQQAGWYVTHTNGQAFVFQTTRAKGTSLELSITLSSRFSATLAKLVQLCPTYGKASRQLTRSILFLICIIQAFAAGSPLILTNRQGAKRELVLPHLVPPEAS